MITARLLLIPVLAFVCEFVDTGIGMGYGTILTPVLLLMGYEPLQIVPAILFSEFVSGITAAILHQRAGNVEFNFINDPENILRKRLGSLGYLPKSRHSRVALALAVCSIIGTVTAVVVAVSISKKLLKAYIGLLAFFMGVIILWKRKTKPVFSWKRIFALGAVASFNKGVSGGGYGPLVTSGQILSGLSSKNSVAITSLAESLTCIVGVITYCYVKSSVDWALAPYLAVGALAAVPLSVKAVKKTDESKLTLVIGLVTVLLGLITLSGI